MEKASPKNFYHYNNNLKDKASHLRKNMTKAEACLWKYVFKAASLNGYTFKRQRPILSYIVDFVCLDLMLIIEVDGLTHTYENVSQNDIERQDILESIGFKVLRFEDEEVLHHIDRVKKQIIEIMNKIIEPEGRTSPFIPLQEGDTE
jgi:very-short-patch-repair endonuclease